MVRHLRRFVLVPILFGTIVLALLEGALQLGAFVVRTANPRATPAWLTGDIRILCVGDSNTFGLHPFGGRIPDEETYPAQLERIWNGSGIGSQVEVINAAILTPHHKSAARKASTAIQPMEPCRWEPPPGPNRAAPTASSWRRHA